jgi:hypothetical protein
MMVPLNLPVYDFTIKTRADKNYIFDSIRKKYVLLTPEEWVRQNFVRYLTEEKGYPKGLCKVEGYYKRNNLSNRFDILIYNNHMEPIVLVECKAQEVDITKSVFDQVVHYALQYNARLLIVTNGMKHFCCQWQEEMKQYQFIHEIPDFMDI